MVFAVDFYRDKASFKLERFGIFGDYSIAFRFSKFLKTCFYSSSVCKVPVRQFLNERFEHPISVCRVVGTKRVPLGYFKTVDCADTFIHFYSAAYPYTKLIIIDHGMPTSTLDSESTLF